MAGATEATHKAKPRRGKHGWNVTVRRLDGTICTSVADVSAMFINAMFKDSQGTFSRTLSCKFTLTAYVMMDRVY